MNSLISKKSESFAVKNGSMRYNKINLSASNYTNFLTRYHPQLRIVLDILNIYNPRISEILNAKWSNYTKGKFLILDGLKRSRNIIIRDRGLLSAIENLERYHTELIFPLVSYNKVWRSVQELFPDLIHRSKKGKNRHVTHAFRFKNVSTITNDKKVRDILNHTSLSSGKYYQPNIKESPK